MGNGVKLFSRDDTVYAWRTVRREDGWKATRKPA